MRGKWAACGLWGERHRAGISGTWRVDLDVDGRRHRSRRDGYGRGVPSRAGYGYRNRRWGPILTGGHNA